MFMYSCKKKEQGASLLWLCLFLFLILFFFETKRKKFSFLWINYLIRSMINERQIRLWIYLMRSQSCFLDSYQSLRIRKKDSWIIWNYLRLTYRLYKFMGGKKHFLVFLNLQILNFRLKIQSYFSSIKIVKPQMTWYTSILLVIINVSQ